MPRFSYSVKFVCGTQESDQRCAPVRRGIYATEINIHNFDAQKRAKVEKTVYLLVRDGKAVGREPELVKGEPFDIIVLPPRTATMDDCCRLNEVLHLSPATLAIGFLELVSNLELNVTAVYTASDLKSNSIAMDVKTVAARKIP